MTRSWMSMVRTVVVACLFAGVAGCGVTPVDRSSNGSATSALGEDPTECREACGTPCIEDYLECTAGCNGDTSCNSACTLNRQRCLNFCFHQCPP